MNKRVTTKRLGLTTTLKLLGYTNCKATKFYMLRKDIKKPCHLQNIVVHQMSPTSENK